MYSHSKISTYENCPHQFRLKYIDQVDVERMETVEAFLGSRVHETLEKLYRELILSKLNPLDALLSYYETLWKKNWHEGILITRHDFTERNYLDTGKRAISDYYRRYHPFESRTLAVEKQIVFKLRDRYTFMGFIDRLDATDEGTYEIHDYKTSATLPLEDYLQRDRQLALYQIGLRQHFSDADNVRLVWHYLVFDKEFVIEKTEEELEEIEAGTVELIEAIESDTDFKPRENPLCEWCDYPELCSVKRHIVKTEELPLDEFLKDEGVSLVNRYVEIKSGIRKFEGELSDLRDRIISFSSKEGLTGLRGSNHILKINEKDTYSLSLLDESERKEIERLIKDAGMWEELSSLNVSALKRLLSESAPDDVLSRRIKELAEPYKEIRITVRPIEEEE